jgi:hypothetical protein
MTIPLGSSFSDSSPVTLSSSTLNSKEGTSVEQTPLSLESVFDSPHSSFVSVSSSSGSANTSLSFVSLIRVLSSFFCKDYIFNENKTKDSDKRMAGILVFYDYFVYVFV